MHCEKGHSNPDGQKFCGECGLPVIDQPAKRPPQSTWNWVAPAEPRPSGPDEPAGPPTGSSPSGRHSRRNVLVAVVALVLLVAGIFVGHALTQGPSLSSRYLSALQAQGLSSQFAAPAAAVNTAKSFCSMLANGAKDQGSPTQKVGVQYFCPAYEKSFYVLRKTQVTGEFVISNASYDIFNEFATPNFTEGDNGCQGSSGYGDLNSDTAVVVTDDQNNVLARTTLGTGVMNGSPSSLSGTCVFTFNFNVTEGANQYVVSVGRRGSSTYTFNQLLQPDAVALIIGNK